MTECCEFPLRHDWRYGFEKFSDQRNRICIKCHEKEVEHWQRVDNPDSPKNLTKQVADKFMEDFARITK